jgi:glycine cleavage system aminomethyltransferase T
MDNWHKLRPELFQKAAMLPHGMYQPSPWVNRPTPQPKQTVVSIAFPEGADGLDGTEITVKGRLAGVVSMAIPSPALGGKMLALGRIDTAHATEGTVVSVEDSIGTVVSMPAYDPDRKRTRG